MTDYPTGSPAAGWYTDPADASQQRWWGGSQWTHETRPLPAPAVAPTLAAVPGGGINPFAAAATQGTPHVSTIGSSRPVGSRGSNDFSAFNSLGTSDFDTVRSSYDVSGSWHENNRRGYEAVSGTNGQATAGLVLSLIGLSTLGIVFSAIGLRRARRYEDAGGPPVGRTRSRWGMGLGVTSVVLSTLVVAGAYYFWPQIVMWVDERRSSAGSSSAADDGSYSREAYEQEIYDDYIWEEEGTPLSVTCPPIASTAPGNTITCQVVLPDRTDTWTAQYYQDGLHTVVTESVQN